jgi:cytosine/adenosine deaminase-related metal-dependent hydrolase
MSRYSRTQRFLADYDKLLLQEVMAVGGFFNAHAHLDRADTLDALFLDHIHTSPLEASLLPLRVKQNVVGDLHRGEAYRPKKMMSRMSHTLERLIGCGTRRVDTCIDATTGVGLRAIEIALKLKRKFAGRIEIRIAPNPIFGFKDGTDRWEIFQQAAQQTDYLSALPEKDDFVSELNRDGKIGFRAHIQRVMELGCRLQKEVHLHLDQANDPNERGTEVLLEGLDWIESPKIPGHVGPTVWVIHMISPSAYSDERFQALVDKLKKHKVGVIVCPTAAISMRQLRPVPAPTHNSIARVLDLCFQKVPVRLGSDNIADLFVPQGDGDMLTEVKFLGHAARFAAPHVWAKLAAGVGLNNVDLSAVERAIHQDQDVFASLPQNGK